jgi:hypothetical protein
VTRFLIVTHEGPCIVPRIVHDAIRSRKREDQSFARQILLVLKMNDFESLDIEILNDKLPEVTRFEDFLRLYIMADPPERRSIIL